MARVHLLSNAGITVDGKRRDSLSANQNVLDDYWEHVILHAHVVFHAYVHTRERALHIEDLLVHLLGPGIVSDSR